MPELSLSGLTKAAIAGKYLMEKNCGTMQGRSVTSSTISRREQQNPHLTSSLLVTRLRPVIVATHGPESFS